MTTMVGRRVFTLLAIIGALLAVPVMGYAQEATLSGTVTDSTGGVLPGVKIGRASCRKECRSRWSPYH